MQIEALEMGLVSPEFVQQHIASLQNRLSWQQQYGALTGPEAALNYSDLNAADLDGRAGQSIPSNSVRAVAGGAMTSTADQKEIRKGWSYAGAGINLGLGGAPGEAAGVDFDSLGSRS